MSAAANPPMATATGAPVHEATMPALTSPSWGPPAANVACAAATRPRSRSGVSRFRSVWRWETLTESAAPLAARKARESQRFRLRAKAVMLSPGGDAGVRWLERSNQPATCLDICKVDLHTRSRFVAVGYHWSPHQFDANTAHLSRGQSGLCAR